MTVLEIETYAKMSRPQDISQSKLIFRHFEKGDESFVVVEPRVAIETETTNRMSEELEGPSLTSISHTTPLP